MSRQWYYLMRGEEIGPLAMAELRNEVESGEITVDTYVRRGRKGLWVSAEQVEGLFEKPPPTPPSPDESRQGSPADDAAQHLSGPLSLHPVIERRIEGAKLQKTHHSYDLGRAKQLIGTDPDMAMAKCRQIL
jgi:hypothetical protein